MFSNTNNTYYWNTHFSYFQTFSDNEDCDFEGFEDVDNFIKDRLIFIKEEPLFHNDDLLPQCVVSKLAIGLFMLQFIYGSPFTPKLDIDN